MRQWMAFVLAAGLCAGAAAQTPTAKHVTKKPVSKTAAKSAKKAVEPAKPAAEADALPSEQTVDAFLRRMWGYNDNVAFKVISVKPSEAKGLSEVVAGVSTPQGQQVLKFFVTADGEHAIMGDLTPFGADPFAKARAMLKKEAFGPSKGPKNAPMEIVEFADLECPACKAALPVVQRLQQDFPQVRFIFQSFPLEQLHPWAARAAQYLDCMARKSDDSAWTFIESVYTHQAEINQSNLKEKLDKYVGFGNEDPAQISACADAPETITHVQQSIEIGKELNVSQTPTLFVNGRSIAGVNPQDYDTLKSIVEFEVQEAAQGK